MLKVVLSANRFVGPAAGLFDRQDAPPTIPAERILMQLGLFVFSVFLSAAVQAAVPAPWSGQSESVNGRVSQRAEVTFGEVGVPWERLEAAVVGGFVGGSIGLIVGAAASALSSRSEDVLSGHGTNYAVAGVRSGPWSVRSPPFSLQEPATS
ncbi:MAG: hypothetical protein JSU73_12185 [candidate division WOR-3 bacterium]|nr:MAG: hypothetical protein JSU73_12185 [candidate division WOR-3 bacterium]